LQDLCQISSWLNLQTFISIPGNKEAWYTWNKDVCEVPTEDSQWV